MKGFIGNSGSAYTDMYPKVAKQLEKGKKVTIEYVDLDRNPDKI